MKLFINWETEEIYTEEEIKTKIIRNIEEDIQNSRLERLYGLVDFISNKKYSLADWFFFISEEERKKIYDKLVKYLYDKTISNYEVIEKGE